MWHWNEQGHPPTVWRWEDVWVYPDEKETILSACVQSFVSVSQEETRTAAESYREVGVEVGTW